MPFHIRSILLFLTLILFSFLLNACTSTTLVPRVALASEAEVVFSSGSEQGLVTLDERIQFEALKAENIVSSGDTLYWDDPDNGDLCAAHIRHVKIITLFNKRRGMQNGMLTGGAAGGLITLLLSESQKAKEEGSEEDIGIQGIAAGVFAGGLAGVLIGAFSGSPDNYRLSDTESDYHSLDKNRETSPERKTRKRRKRIYGLDGE